MEENKKKCPVCGTLFMAQRSSRVYCSDKCRGQAFLLKKAEELFGTEPALQTDNAVSDEQTSNGKKVVIVETEELISRIEELLRKTVREELRLTINANDNNRLTSNDNKTGQTELKSAIPLCNEEFIVQSQMQDTELTVNANDNNRLTSNDNKTGQTELKSEIPLCNEEIIVQPEKQHTELTVNANNGLTSNDNSIIASNDKQTDEKETKSSETVENTNVLKPESEKGNENGLPLNANESNAKSKKEVFEYHPSAFINEMVETVEYRDYADKFQYPHHHFNQDEAKEIKNVNLFVRCLLESTIKLSRHKSVPLGELGKLTQGYWYVIHSNKFKQIRNIYPASETITEIATTLLNQHEHFEDNSTMRFVLSRELKMEIISMLHEIKDSVPLYKFSELFTNEVLKTKSR